MHPERASISFALPAPPEVAFEVEGRTERAPAELTTVRILPEKHRVALTYVARSGPLPRVFLPGVHRQIPLAVSATGFEPLRYEPPVPVRDRLRAASAT